jgi:hypothetical protein
MCKEMLGILKKASFFQGIGPNPLFAIQDTYLYVTFQNSLYRIVEHSLYLILREIPAFYTKTHLLVAKYDKT